MTKERYTGFNGWSNWANTTNSIPAPNRNTGGGGNIRQTLMVDCMGCRKWKSCRNNTGSSRTMSSGLNRKQKSLALLFNAIPV